MIRNAVQYINRIEKEKLLVTAPRLLLFTPYLVFTIVVKMLTLSALIILMFTGSTVYANKAEDPEGKSLLEEQIGLFADTFFENTLADYHIPGAVFVVVEHGQVIYAKGYGYASLEKSLPVDLEKTMFCAGSVGKLINWTALMQLYETGKFDLGDDVNLYLKNLHIPETFHEPITFHPYLQLCWAGLCERRQKMLSKIPGRRVLHVSQEIWSA